MYRHAGKSVGGALASAIYLAGTLSFSALAQGAPPDFAPNASIGWYAYSRQFIPPPSGPGPRCSRTPRVRSFRMTNSV